jgi:NNP family nitrate/nitrite transporter-like MFS transporter
MQRHVPATAEDPSLRPLAPAYFAVLGLSMVLFAHAASAPVVQQALGLTYTELGVLLSAIIAGHALLQPITGWLFVRLGPDRALRWALIYVLATSVVAPLVERYDLLLVLRFAQGLGTGHLFVFAISYVAARSTPATNRQRQAFVGASNGFGPALLFVAAPLLVGWLGWRGPWLLPIAVLALAAAALIGVRPLAAKPGAPTVDLGTYARLLRSARVWALGAAHAASFGIFVALTSWLTTFLLGVTGGDASRSAQVTAGLLVMGGIARLFSAPAATRWGDRRLIAGALSVGAAALAGLGLVSWPPGVLALGVLAIWCCSFTFAAVFQLAYFTGRAGDGPVVVALLNWITLLVGTALPALFGWLTDRTGGFLAGFLLYALVSLVGASSVTWWQATPRAED